MYLGQTGQQCEYSSSSVDGSWHDHLTSFYYRDPDGNYVELQVDNFGLDPNKSTAFMHTPPFLVNPIGVPINSET